VIQAALAHPADARLQRLQRRQQQVAQLALLAAAVRGVRIAHAAALTAIPGRLRRAEHGMDGGTFVRRGRGVEQLDVHQRRP